MIKNILFLLIAVSFFQQSDAQNMRKLLKKRTAEAAVYGNLGYYGNPHWGLGANIHYLHGIGRGKQRLSIGCGLRANVFFSKNRDYTTSSPVLTARNRGGADTMFMGEVQTNSLNAYIAIKIHIKRGVDVHINTDLGGVNFGDSKIGYFRSYETNPLPPGTKYKSEPYAFNANMLNASYGSIMTEAYGSFRLNEVLWWRLGFNYFRNEYKIDSNIPMNGKRFYQNHIMVMTALAFDLRWKKNLEQARILY